MRTTAFRCAVVAALFLLFPQDSFPEEALTSFEAAQFEAMRSRAVQSFSNGELAEYLRLRRKANQIDDVPDPADRVAHYALKSLGQPYRRGALRLDLSESDCVTLVERCIALACADQWDSFYKVSTCLRHQGGVEDVLSRNLLPLADWVPANSWLLADATGNLAVPIEEFEEPAYRKRLLQNTRYGAPAAAVLPDVPAIQLGAFQNHENAEAKVKSLAGEGLFAVAEQRERNGLTLWIVMIPYATPEEAAAALPKVRELQPSAQLTEATMAEARAAAIATAPEVEILTHTYISREHVPAALPRLRSGDIALVIRELDHPQRGVLRFCDHMGILVRDPDGVVTLVHSAPPRVRQQDLREFLHHYPTVIGLKILRLRKGALELAASELDRLDPLLGVRQPEQVDEKTQAVRALRAGQ